MLMPRTPTPLFESTDDFRGRSVQIQRCTVGRGRPGKQHGIADHVTDAQRLSADCRQQSLLLRVNRHRWRR